MNVLPLHPKLVHLPIALAVLMPLVSASFLLAWVRGWFPRRTWLAAVALQGLLVIGALAAQRTGAQDEDRAEAAVGKAAIEAHEEAAEQFTAVAAAVLAFAVGAAALRPEKAARALAVLTLAGTLAVLAMGYRVGEAGGRIVYGAGGPAAALGAPAPGGEGHHRSKHHDD